MNDDVGDPPPLDDDHPLAKFVPGLADIARDAFRGYGDMTRGELLKTFRSSEHVAIFRSMIETMVEKEPEATREDVLEGLRELLVGLYDRVAIEAGFEGPEKASYLGAFRRGFEMAASGEEGESWAPPLGGYLSDQALGLRAALAGPARERNRFLEDFYVEWFPRIQKARLEDYADRPDHFEVYKTRLIQGFKVMADIARLDPSQAETFDRAVQKLFDEDGDMIVLMGDNPRALDSCLGVLAARLRETFGGPPEELERHLDSYRTFVRGFKRFYLDMVPPGLLATGDREANTDWAMVAVCLHARVMLMARRLAAMADLTEPQAEAFALEIRRAYDVEGTE